MKTKHISCAKKPHPDVKGHLPWLPHGTERWHFIDKAFQSISLSHQQASIKVVQGFKNMSFQHLNLFLFLCCDQKVMTMYYTQNKSTIITWSNLYFWMQEMRWMISSFTLNYEKSRSNKAGACIKFEYQTNIYNLPSYTCTIYIWICIWKILLTVTQRL